MHTTKFFLVYTVLRTSYIRMILIVYVCMYALIYMLCSTVYVAALVVCDPTCDHGVCISTNSCNCAAGYSGPTCSMPGELIYQTFFNVYLYCNITLRITMYCTTAMCTYTHYNSNEVTYRQTDKQTDYCNPSCRPRAPRVKNELLCVYL